jgi:hypothetical protein
MVPEGNKVKENKNGREWTNDIGRKKSCSAQDPEWLPGFRDPHG